MGPTFEPIHGKGQTRRAFRQVRGIDLGQIAHANDLGARAGTGDEGFHLLGRQVLRLIDDHDFVHEGAPAHEVHALDLDAAADQFVGGGTAPFTGRGFGFGQGFEVIVQGTHPGAHFFFFGAR